MEFDKQAYTYEGSSLSAVLAIAKAILGQKNSKIDKIVVHVYTATLVLRLY